MTNFAENWLFFKSFFFTKNIKKSGKQLWQSTVLESPILWQTLPIMKGATTITQNQPKHNNEKLRHSA
jgi:hypothetical protein